MARITENFPHTRYCFPNLQHALNSNVRDIYIFNLFVVLAFPYFAEPYFSASVYICVHMHTLYCVCVCRDLAWLDTRCPQKLLPLLSWTGEKKMQRRARGLRQGQGEITRQSPSWAKQTRLGEISLIYSQSKWNRIMRN